ncbi:protein of unknown function (plasmid) [Caballeronia sp. S22]
MGFASAALIVSKAFLEFNTMMRGIHPVSGQREVLPDRTEAGKKCRRAFGFA